MQSEELDIPTGVSSSIVNNLWLCCFMSVEVCNRRPAFSIVIRAAVVYSEQQIATQEEKTMDLLIEGFKTFGPIVVIIASIVVFSWKVPSKKDVERVLNILRADMIRLNDKMGTNFHAVYDKMDTNFRTINDKIDANFQTTQADIRKLNDKIESYSQATHERIDNASTELRAEIRTMNQNYIDHLARHEEQALKARETQGD